MKIEELSIQTIIDAIARNKSKRSTLRFLGFPENNVHCNWYLDAIIESNELDVSHFITYKDLAKINAVIANCHSLSEVIKSIGYSKNLHSFNSRTFRKVKTYIETHGLDISHFDRFGSKINSAKRYAEVDIFCRQSRTSNNTVKKRYLRKRTENYHCDECTVSSWNGKTIVLQLDHINGLCDDNRLENLRLLCPNCHSQTLTFAGRRRKSHE